jgi:ABC-type uncharacterized transport system substrate-binding protein
VYAIFCTGYGLNVGQRMILISKTLKLYSLFLVLFFLISCAPVETKKEHPEPSEPSAPAKKNIVEKKVIKEKQSVLILLSSQNPFYQQLAEIISLKLKKPAVIKALSGQPASNSKILKEIEGFSEVTHIVSIGVKATKLVKGLKNKRIIFAQVVNFQGQGLVTNRMKGVSALPSPEKLFKDWRVLSPNLSSVAVVAGKNLEGYLLRAKKAAESHGIELFVEQVKTDKEFIYKSKSLSPKIEGQWVLPDNRVLSAKALKEVMAYASRRGRQLVVFSPKLLSFGGFLAVSEDVDSIAEGVLQRVEDSADMDVIPGNGVLPVMSHTMGINRNIARQLNLNIPQEYQAYVNGE